MNYLVIGLYVISFALFIYGLDGPDRGPRRRCAANLIAAVGHGGWPVTANADQDPGTPINGLWIIAGSGGGRRLGRPARPRFTKMTAIAAAGGRSSTVSAGGTVALIATRGIH